MLPFLRREPLEKFIAHLPLRTTASACGGAGMRLVDNDELRTGLKKFAAAALALHVVKADDSEREPLENGLGWAQATFKLLGGGSKDKFRFNVELLTHFLLPLLGKVRRAKH